MTEDILDSLREPELSRGHRNRNFLKRGEHPRRCHTAATSGSRSGCGEGGIGGGRLAVPKDVKEFEAGVTGQSKRQDRWARQT